MAAYHVDAEGRTVVVQRATSHAPSVRTFLFGTVLAILCQRRALLPLHACCVKIEGPRGPCAIAFAGPSGSGKSTLAATFLRRGHELLADDITVLDLIDGQAIVRPSIPHVKLWHDTLIGLKRPIDGLERVREDLEKYCLPLGPSFCSDGLPLAAIYHLSRVRDERHVEWRALRGLEAALHLSQAIYLDRTMMRFAGGAEQLLGAVTRLAAVVPAHRRLSIIDGLDHLDALAQDIVECQGSGG